MSFRIAIVESDEARLHTLTQSVTEMNYVLAAAYNTRVAATASLAEARPDLVLLDVHLEGPYQGIELARYIRQHLPIPFVFITQVLDKQTVDAVKQTIPAGYIISPFTHEDLYAAIEMALMHHAVHHEARRRNTAILSEPNADRPILLNDAVFIKQKTQFVKLHLQELAYVEACDNYVTLVATQAKHLLRSTIKQMEEALPQHFVRIHRSYIINLEKLDGFNPDQAFLAGFTLPIGKNYHSSLVERLSVLGS